MNWFNNRYKRWSTCSGKKYFMLVSKPEYMRSSIVNLSTKASKVNSTKWHNNERVLQSNTIRQFMDNYTEKAMMFLSFLGKILIIWINTQIYSVNATYIKKCITKTVRNGITSVSTYWTNTNPSESPVSCPKSCG